RVVQLRDGGEGLAKIGTGRRQRADSVGVHGDVEVDPPRVGVTKAGRRGVDERLAQVRVPVECARAIAGEGLVQVPRLDVPAQRRAAVRIFGGPVELEGAAHMDLVDTDAGPV